MTAEDMKAMVRELCMLQVNSPEWVTIYNAIIDAFEAEDEERDRQAIHKPELR
jgi:hypothetical protein